MFLKNIFAERIKSLRMSNKVTQTALAELLNVTRTQISDLENGKTTTSIERLCTLADFFNVSVDYLVGLSDEPEKNINVQKPILKEIIVEGKFNVNANSEQLKTLIKYMKDNGIEFEIKNLL